ncbi:MAG: DEAD/DEAH box helicase family protein [Elusimicrobiota bacterium]|jgi:ERCC4-related helicase|nr:DEAD/DEAH box helicase family protein [Elusimicrobiota bacterium]
MLLDNKTQSDGKPFKVVDFLKQNAGQGELNLVTAFFSVNVLALLHDKLSCIEKFKMVLGKLSQQDMLSDKIIDLLVQDLSIDNSLSLSCCAKRAIDFLKQDKVEIKTVERNFCHAKTYIYKDSDIRKCFHIIGSSNLTDAGLGMHDSSNIELNTATYSANNDWKEAQFWFENLWKNTALEKIEMPDKTKISAKQHIIDMLFNMCKQYSPKDLYYKVLYELFKTDLLSLSKDADFNAEIQHLKETVIYKTLYPYQQSGVISLIAMLQKHNGAILADAVGLGKTWTALAVMKYFQSKGYTVILFCPKKLENNWRQYKGQNSRFEKDEIDYIVRYHSDLQDERLDVVHYPDFPLSKICRKQKLLIVIDESHNLRNDKSSRYKYFVDKILQPQKANNDVKILQLSATPINNKLLDIRNQFKLISRGQDDGFNEKLQIKSLESLFRIAQKDYVDWINTYNHKISDFIEKLPEKFFHLTDSLIVARTRRLIETKFGTMRFPKKEKPINEYIAPENIGNLKTFDDILDAIKVDMTAYRPSNYIEERKHARSVLEDEVKRESFLVRMMYILLIKRLESSWHSFKITVEKILESHKNALNKVNMFIEKEEESYIDDELDENDRENLQDSATELPIEENFELGKRNPIKLSQITEIKKFQEDLKKDTDKLQKLQKNLEVFESEFNENISKTNDVKFERLIKIIKEKEKQENKKILIFTVYSDTANFLYKELKKRNFKNLGFVSGNQSETFDGYSGKKFEIILERFAPYTKLYNEKDWSALYEKHFNDDKYFVDGKWKVSYDKWLEAIEKHDAETLEKIRKPIDVLISTDCLSEGQNLQDCDMVVNYDIHWNPVRLIQRMGRIDRIGSPNKSIKGINFWPAKGYEGYLNLKTRVENRMAIMTLAGTELDNNLTPEFKEIVKENPLISEQTQKMLQQMQLTWDDIEDNQETLGLSDLSLEQFRQDLFEFFKQKEDFFKQMPNGIFSGFKIYPDKKYISMVDSIVAVLGYPKRPENVKDYTYSKIHLLHQPIDAMSTGSVLKNRQEVLSFLRFHKEEERYVPDKIEKGDSNELQKLSKAIDIWLKSQIEPTAIGGIRNLFSDSTNLQTTSPEQKKIEEEFKAKNFDLITWTIITK